MPLPLPISVSRPLNPQLDCPCHQAGFNADTLQELTQLGLYFVVDILLRGSLVLLTDAARENVTEILESFDLHLGDLPNCGAIGQNLPRITLIQTSLFGPVDRALADLTRNYCGIIGTPTPLAMALLPRISMMEALHGNLDRLLASHGLHQQMTLDEVFKYTPPVSVDATMLWRFSVDVHNTKMPRAVVDWVLQARNGPSATVFDAWQLMMTVGDAPPELKQWFTEHGFTTDPLLAADYERVLKYSSLQG
jgi:hypothetical protein